MLEIFLKWVVPFVCGGIITWAITYIKMRKKRDTALEEGVQCLLRAEIISAYREYQHKRYCPIYAKDSLKRMYRAYHNLGGNDVATGLYTKTLDLPEEPPEEDEE